MLSEIYRGYIACLNAQDWLNLGTFVHDALHYNGRALTLDDYREMLIKDFREIPDLFFDIQMLIEEPPRIAGPRLIVEATRQLLYYTGVLSPLRSRSSRSPRSRRRSRPASCRRCSARTPAARRRENLHACA